jgi:glyoxylase-like metal-dependent hydrolase (beta-lactamase superfamily II)
MKYLNIYLILGICIQIIGFDAKAVEENWTQEQWNKVELKTEHVAGNFYVINGLWRGNSGVFVGEDGVVLIDSQFAPLTDKLLADIAGISNKNVKYVINTHSHTDHIGGNQKLSKQGAMIIAHKKVKEDMENDHENFMMNIPSTPSGLPNITYTDRLNLYTNGEEVQIIHVNNAHTDDDSIIYFKGSNVIHMGDIYFTSGLPYIDTNIGGSINGMIHAVELVLTMSDRQTKIIAGHGPVGDKEGLKRYLIMLKNAYTIISNEKKQGKNISDIQESPDAFLKSIKEPWVNSGIGGRNHFISSVFKSI